MDELDYLIHQPVRTQLVAYLAAAEEQTFADLKRQFDVSDGNLDAHLKKLLAADYVTVRRETGCGRPQSYFSLTVRGREALARYITALHHVLEFAGSKTVTSPAQSAWPVSTTTNP